MDELKTCVGPEEGGGSQVVRATNNRLRLFRNSFILMFLSTRMLDFLSKSIKEKEVDLECPVCMETAEVPIYMCQVRDGD